MQKLIQPPACLDHGLHVLNPRSFPPNHAPKMRKRHQLFFGLGFMSKEFQHPAIHTKIDQHFSGVPITAKDNSNKKLAYCFF
jgi:hypothetical protein